MASAVDTASQDRPSRLPAPDDPMTGSIPQLLAHRVATTPDDVYIRFEGESLTFGLLAERVDEYVELLLDAGVRPGDRVILMLGTGPVHACAVLANMVLGSVAVSVDTRAADWQLDYFLSQVEPSAVIAGGEHAGRMRGALADRGGSSALLVAEGRAMRVERACGPDRPAVRTPLGDDVVCIIYTSGTSGPPKGAMITDRMLRTAAESVLRVTGACDGEVFFQWEPLNHIGGLQMLVVGLLKRVTLGMVPRFSATRFWQQVRDADASYIHYLGGVLQILMSGPPDPADADNPARVAWGAGATPDIWRAFETRFGVEIREVYGLTESASINTINADRTVGSMGMPIDPFRVKVVTDAGDTAPVGVPGEIRIQADRPGLMSAGYFDNPEATAALYRDGWLHTGDLAYRDADGRLFYVGRRSDSVRRRGENISAWEVEHIARDHPDVSDCALVGVPSELGEEELKLFIQTVDGSDLDLPAFIEWCEERMPPHHVPRYIALVDSFERGPSMRVAKGRLSRSTDDSWER